VPALRRRVLTAELASRFARLAGSDEYVGCHWLTSFAVLALG